MKKFLNFHETISIIVSSEYPYGKDYILCKIKSNYRQSQNNNKTDHVRSDILPEILHIIAIGKIALAEYKFRMQI